ncbi:zinc finger and SCAN domain-containing protein 4-like [Chaetodon trifascialis]|uniref:zinc finger and SCAN domain-containing protein 4-like n=1 Tax=Chaetodon trifascialis TaxID=109706 RepID=UPI003996BA40
MEEMTAFHFKLSSIMEKLLVSAVTEIKQLVCEYSAVLRAELSREKQDNSVLREELKLHRPVSGITQRCQHGKDGAGAQLQTGETERNAGWRNEDTAKEQEEGTSRFADCKIEPVTVKCEATPEEQPELRAPPVHSPPCSQVDDSSQHQDAGGQSSQICSEPSEDSKDLHTGFKQSVETQCQLSILQSGEQFIDLGFHIKRESESPDLQTPGDNVNLGLELQRGILCQMYTDSEAFPVCSTVPDTPALSCFSSSDPSGTLDIPDASLNRQHAADRDTFGHQGNLFESGSRSCSVSAFGANQAAGRFKYVCDYCGKGFPFLSMMKCHRLKHTGERTQVCGQCGMTFIRRSHLRRHELLHLGVRPFTCQICGRKFSRSAHLSAHMKTHCR